MSYSKIVGVTVLTAAVSILVTDVRAQEQNRDQQKCITSVNKAASKVSKSQGKANETCIKFGLAGKLPALGVSAQDCLTMSIIADKVNKSTAKVIETFAKRCTASAPDFAVTDDTTVNTAAKGEGLELMQSLFGGDLDAVIAAATSKGDQKCVRGVLKTADRLVATQLKEFNKCKKLALKNGASSSGDIQACLSTVQADSNLKVEKARDKLAKTVTKSCAGVPLGPLFLGDCPTGDNASFTDCVTQRAVCSSCELLGLADNIQTDCDTIDNGVLDYSCSKFCSTAGDCASGVCSGGVCQAPQCNDGVQNGNETDVDCGGSDCAGTNKCAIGEGCVVNNDCQPGFCTGGICSCGDQLYVFNISSNNGGATDPAEWPGGSASQNNGTGVCNVTIDRPSGNLDVVGNLGDDFSVLGFNGYANCFGSGGEDGDGCVDGGCPPAGIGSCEGGRPSCSAALNGSGNAAYNVQCND